MQTTFTLALIPIASSLTMYIPGFKLITSVELRAVFCITTFPVISNTVIDPGNCLNSILNKTYIVQHAMIKEKKDDLDRFIAIIREKLKKYNIAYPVFQFDPHISFARLDSKDAEIIELIKRETEKNRKKEGK